MTKSILGVAFFAVLMVNAASADDAVKKVRMASCSNVTMVCAVMKDGTFSSTTECDAPKDGVRRVLPGGCYDDE